MIDEETAKSFQKVMNMLIRWKLLKVLKPILLHNERPISVLAPVIKYLNRAKRSGLCTVDKGNILSNQPTIAIIHIPNENTC